MNHVERFRAVMNFQAVDLLPRWEWTMWWDQNISPSRPAQRTSNSRAFIPKANSWQSRRNFFWCATIAALALIGLAASAAAGTASAVVSKPFPNIVFILADDLGYGDVGCEALSRAIHWARPGDVVVVAGKGHEATQTFAHGDEPFDDVIELRRALASAGWAD